MDEKSSVNETKKWRWLALLWGVLTFVFFAGLVGMIVGAISKKTDRVSWAIFVASAVAITAISIAAAALSPSESNQSEEVIIIITPTATPANFVRMTDPSNTAPMTANQERLEIARANYQEKVDALNASPSETTARAECRGVLELSEAMIDMMQSPDPSDKEIVAMQPFTELQWAMLEGISVCYRDDFVTFDESGAIIEAFMAAENN